MSSDTNPDTLRSIAFGSFVGAIISVCFDVLTVATFAAIGRLRKFLSVYYVFLLLTRARHPAELFVFRVLCSTALDILAIIGYLTLSIDLLIAIRNPFSFHQEYFKYYHLLVWSLSLLSALLPLPFILNAYGLDVNDVCWIDASDTHFDYIQLLFYYGWVLGVIVFSSYVLFVAQRAFRRGFPETFEVRARTLRQSRVYLVVISTYLTVNLILWFAHAGYEYQTDQRSTALLYCFVVLRALRGIVDFTAWIINNTSSFTALHRSVSRPVVSYWRARASRGGSSSSDEIPFENTNFDRSIPSTSSSSSIALPETTINQALRREIMLCTTWGISDSLEQPTLIQQRQNTRSRSSRSSRRIQRRIHLPLTVSNHAFEFFDYETDRFRSLRELGGVHDPEYAKSFLINDEGESLSMLEKFTEGRSGSFFYFTGCFKYIVKTVNDAERHFLQSFLDQYLSHLRDQPDSLLNRFFGLHAVCAYFLLNLLNEVISVMKNIFAFQSQTSIKLHEIYDLKGSSVHRRVLKKGRKVKDAGTLKDLDLTRKITLGAESKAKLLLQLSNDVAFLNSVNIMDYSLLLGIHNCDAACADQHQNSGAENSNGLHGGVSGSGPDESTRSLYFFGIIDMLQTYNFKKAAENFFKTKVRRFDPNGVSAINSDRYAARFLRNVSAKFA